MAKSASVNRHVESTKKARANAVARRREIIAEIAKSGVTGKGTADLLRISEVISALDRSKNDEFRAR